MRVVLVGTAMAWALVLAGCGARPSAVEQKDHEAASAASDEGGSRFASGGGDRGEGRRDDPRDAPAPQIDGRPLWAASRQHSAEENARAQFSRNGADFGARTEDDYVSRAHAFIDHPPAGAEVVERSNGDRLIYDPKGNIFAVVNRSGAPRTLFKPRDGAAYWAQQKSREDHRNRPADPRDDG